jgi:putative ATPase
MMISKQKKTASQDSLFTSPAGTAPLAEQLRPQTLAEVIGQEHLTGPDGILRRMVEAQHLQSVILWGPPGCGKTTIARLLAQEAGYAFEQVSAVASGMADLKKHFEIAVQKKQTGQRPALFVDEIHRFNRAQQDVLLPVMEDGTIVLIGATTENPSFELNSALLSRARVLVLNRLSAEALGKMLQRAEKGLGFGDWVLGKEGRLPLTNDARTALIAMADGDGRYLLTMVEAILDAWPHSPFPKTQSPLTPESLSQLLQQRPPVYDKAQESHYNLISALHKSMRGSDVDAALYWFARMLAGGEDPRYIVRRLVRFAVEDIGMADPQAHVQALSSAETYERLGSPEGELAIAQAVIYLATAPKSNAQYTAFKAAKRAAMQHGSLMPPKHILNAPTKLMGELGYGKNYAYDHDAADGFSGQNYFPDDMARETYYNPVERGFERDIRKRLDYWQNLRAKIADSRQ